MTYTEAKVLTEKHKGLIGQPLGEYVVKHIIISPLNNLSEVASTYSSNGLNNKSALIELGLLNSEDLSVYLFPSFKIPLSTWDELENYLSKKGLSL
jgi:hypothetical protein